MSTSTSRRQSASVNAASRVRQSNPAIRSHSGPTVTCKICDASYKPASARSDLLSAGPNVSDASDALEVAFMSMCHFCFRCRRPACPGCWDEVHRVCAECVQEAHLAFRADVPPLQGTIFPAPITASSIGQAAIGSDTAIAPLLICVRPGSFQQRNAPAFTTTIHTQQPIPPVSIQQAQTSSQPKQLEFSNSGASSALYLHETIATPAKKSNVSSYETTTIPAKSSDVPPHGSNKVSILKTAERVLNVILFSLLVAVILLIIVAELSSNANAQIMVLLRVDIRSEIAYILYIIQQMRW